MLGTLVFVSNKQSSFEGNHFQNEEMKFRYIQGHCYSRAKVLFENILFINKTGILIYLNLFILHCTIHVKKYEQSAQM